MVGRSPRCLLQLRVFRLGLFQDGDVGIGVFPEDEEVLIGGLSFGGVAGKGTGAGQSQVSKRGERVVKD